MQSDEVQSDEVLADDVLDRLMVEIHRRARQLPAGSYTTELIRGGVSAIGAKVMEEAGEVVEAAREWEVAAPAVAGGDASDARAEGAGRAAREHLIHEACDVIYHLWVLLGARGITVDELRAELRRREGTSGLEEKRQRGGV